MRHSTGGYSGKTALRSYLCTRLDLRNPFQVIPITYFDLTSIYVSINLVLTFLRLLSCRSRGTFRTCGFESFCCREYAFWSLLNRFLFFRGPKVVISAAAATSAGKRRKLEEGEKEGDGDEKSLLFSLTKEKNKLVFRSGFSGGFGRQKKKKGEKKMKQERSLKVRSLRTVKDSK